MAQAETKPTSLAPAGYRLLIEVVEEYGAARSLKALASGEWLSSRFDPWTGRLDPIGAREWLNPEGHNWVRDGWMIQPAIGMLGLEQRWTIATITEASREVHRMMEADPKVEPYADSRNLQLHLRRFYPARRRH
jgi:hypothetical protein